MKRMLLSVGCAVVLGLTSVSAGMAQEKKKEAKLSERTVRVIMGTAFAGIPDTLPKPGGEMVKVDRSDPKKFMIPVEDAREIIISAVLSARADLCGLKKLEREHFKSIMRKELASKKWSSFQMTYIDVLHATTGLFMTGSQAVGEDAKKKDDPSEDIRAKYKCSDEERDRVKAAVESDIKKLVQAQ